MKKLMACAVITMCYTGFVEQSHAKKGNWDYIKDAADLTKGTIRTAITGNGVINVTTTTEGSSIRANEVEIGNVEASRFSRGAVTNILTINGDYDARESSKIGVVKTK